MHTTELPTHTLSLGRLAALCLGWLLLLPAPAWAQSIWLHPDRPQGISLEVFKPDFNNQGDDTFFSGMYVVSGRVALTPRVKLLADLPLSHYGVDGSGGTLPRRPWAIPT